MSKPSRSARITALVPLLSLALSACQKTTPEPEPVSTADTKKAEPAPAATPAPTVTESSSAPSPAAAAPAAAPTMQVASVPVSPDDPVHGTFTLEDATQGLSGTGTLTAEIQTELGKLECQLYDDKAPITVANFVGLARGLRPFKAPDGKWMKKPAYDGTTFHRVIKGFMIQGGDPQGTGGGEPGYVIPDEVWPGAHHNERGQLCMANRGKNTNGMQFFIMDGVAAHLDGGYTIFGKCSPEDVIVKLASVEVQGDHSVKPTKITKVVIKRKASKDDKATKAEASSKPATSAAPKAAAPPAPASSQ